MAETLVLTVASASRYPTDVSLVSTPHFLKVLQRVAAWREPAEIVPLVTDVTASEFIVVPEIKHPQAYFWTKDWQQGELEADEDIRLGRTARFSNIVELLADLETEGD